MPNLYETVTVYADDHARAVKILDVHPGMPLNEIVGGAVEYFCGLSSDARQRFIEARVASLVDRTEKGVKLWVRDRVKLHALRREHPRITIFVLTGAAITAFARASADDREAVFKRREERHYPAPAVPA